MKESKKKTEMKKIFLYFEKVGLQLYCANPCDAPVRNQNNIVCARLHADKGIGQADKFEA